MFDYIQKELVSIRSESLLRRLRPMERISSRLVRIDGQTLVNFSSNDYLGLSFDPRLMRATVEWALSLGSGSTASRLVCGNSPEYSLLEECVAKFKGSEAALVFGSGWMANVGILSSICDRSTFIFADKFNHASLNSGCQLSGATFRRYHHCDLGHLEYMLNQCADSSRKVVVSDTVFSMDGDIADVGGLESICARHRALLYLDDAHATGVFGDHGVGLGKASSSCMVMGTFSKALGGYGAYLACTRDMRDFLINRCGSFIYSTSPPPSVFGTAMKALEILHCNKFEEYRLKYLSRVSDFRNQLSEMGFDVGNSKTPIIPVMLGDASRALNFSARLFDAGFLGVAIRPPTVPKGGSRIRLTLTAAHTDDDMYSLLSVINAI